MVRKNKIRINITVDKDTLEKAKKKLNLFGGKLSTLFNIYLSDFSESIEKEFSGTHKEMQSKIKELEGRIEKLEKQK